jgi:hypothetical protein
MIVYFMCTYYSQWAHENIAPRSQGQWDAFKFCRAVKNRRINGTLTIPWRSGPETINAQSVGRARWAFGLFIKHIFDQVLHLQSPILVPVPSKDGLIGATTFRSLEMIQEAIAGHGNWTIVPFAFLPAASAGQCWRPARTRSTATLSARHEYSAYR